MPLVDEAWRYLRGVTRGVKNGHLFPDVSRVPTIEAPGGSSRTRTTSRAATALGLGLVESHHRVPLRGLREPVTVLQISDAHVRVPTFALRETVMHLHGLRPDLLVLTGDIMAREWRMPAIHSFLSHLPDAPLGRFAVMGNWEYWSGWDADRWRETLAQHRIVLLHNEAADVGPLTVVGTDDALAGTPDVDAALEGVPAGTPILGLTHTPAYFPEMAARGIPLTLSGHSHGGQIRLPGMGALWLPRGTDRYVAGFYEEDGQQLFVSRGLGWSMAPIRVNCPPEVALHHLLPEHEAVRNGRKA